MKSKRNKIEQEESLKQNNQSTGRRNVGLQTIVQMKEYVSPSVAIQHDLETVEYPKFFAIPHNVTALVVVCAIIFALGQQEKPFFQENLKAGIIGCMVCICAFGMLYFPDSLLRRPHPIFWRFIMSTMILYMLFVTFMLFQSRDDARNYLSFFDSKLGKALPEKNYAENCEVFTNKFPFVDLTNIIDACDNYLTAHLIGWYVKMLIIRDVKLCWFLSVFFEILEITFRHWLPNFWECWWDHVLFDILGCNALGIWLGSITCNYFEMKTYGWIKSQEPVKDKYSKEANDSSKQSNKLKNSLKFLKYFTPNYFAKHEWKIFSSFKRFCLVTWFIIFINLVDLSNFFLKFVLWIPATHYLLFIRVNIWALVAMVSAREYYEYISNKSCKRLGPFVWIAHLTLFIEWSMLYKFSEGFFKEEFPWYVSYFWVVLCVIISGISINLLVKDILKIIRKEKDNNEEQINLLEPGIEIEEFDN